MIPDIHVQVTVVRWIIVVRAMWLASVMSFLGLFLPEALRNWARTRLEAQAHRNVPWIHTLAAFLDSRLFLLNARVCGLLALVVVAWLCWILLAT